jgi:hypothetical protein
MRRERAGMTGKQPTNDCRFPPGPQCHALLPPGRSEAFYYGGSLHQHIMEGVVDAVQLGT